MPICQRKPLRNDEAAATAAWKLLRAESVGGLYILEGGINQWLDTFADDSFKRENIQAEMGEDRLWYTFAAALGARYPFAEPAPDHYALIFTPKIKLEIKRGGGGGGCG